MNEINQLFSQAELALAAYSTLHKGIAEGEYIDALQQDGKGMSATQAADFASRWRVTSQVIASVAKQSSAFIHMHPLDCRVASPHKDVQVLRAHGCAGAANLVIAACLEGPKCEPRLGARGATRAATAATLTDGVPA